MNNGEWMIRHGLHKWIIGAETAAAQAAIAECCPGCDSDLDTCGMCGENKRDVLRRRRNTQYFNEESNWLTCCKECFDEDWAFYEELWADYYSSRL